MAAQGAVRSERRTGVLGGPQGRAWSEREAPPSTPHRGRTTAPPQRLGTTLCRDPTPPAGSQVTAEAVPSLTRSARAGGPRAAPGAGPSPCPWGPPPGSAPGLSPPPPPNSSFLSLLERCRLSSGKMPTGNSHLWGRLSLPPPPPCHLGCPAFPPPTLWVQRSPLATAPRPCQLYREAHTCSRPGCSQTGPQLPTPPPSRTPPQASQRPSVSQRPLVDSHRLAVTPILGRGRAGTQAMWVQEADSDGRRADGGLKGDSCAHGGEQ